MLYRAFHAAGLSLLITAGLGALPSVCRGQQSAATGAAPVRQAAAPLPVWQPDPKQLALLNSPAICGGYTWQPPISFAPVGLPAGAQPPAGVLFYGFAGPYNSDGTRPSLIVTLLPIPATERERSLDSIFREMLGSKVGRWTAVTQTQPKVGKIGTIIFERAYFKGDVTGPSGPIPEQGFVYAALDRGTAIGISAQDVRPYSSRSLPLAEAAVLTFKPRAGE